MQPILLNTDGTLPNNLMLDIVKSLGLTPVHPTERPSPMAGHAIEEGAPELVGDKYFQRWVQVAVAVPEPELLGVLKAQALQTIDTEHQSALMQLTGNPTQAEQTTWAGKVALAEAIQSGTTLSAAQNGFMNAMGIPPTGYAPYAQAVLAKSAQYWTLVGVADKVRSDCKARIEAAQTHAELEQVSASNAAQRDQAMAALAAQRA